MRRGWVPGAVAAAAACSAKVPPADAPTVIVGADGTVAIPVGSPLRSKLLIDTVRTAVVSDVVLAAAAVESDPAHTVKILPPMAGRVVALSVRLGDAVRRGEPLLTLDSPDFTSAQADYTQALAAYRQATHALARERDLAQYGIAATRDVEQAETDDAQAQGDLQRTTARLALLGIDTSVARQDQRLVIRSPIAGRVTELSIGVGEFHNDPTVPIMTVADLSTVWLTADVPEKDLHAVTAGERAAAVLSAYPGDTVRGIVSMIEAVVDTATRMTKVHVTVANPAGRFKPGMYAVVGVAGPPRRTVVIPATAVLQVGDSNVVFVETKPWVLQRRPVVLGAPDHGGVVVRAGLVGGERIVARNAVLLQQ